MKTAYTSAIAILLLVGITTKSFSQCGTNVEMFTNTTAGFTGTGTSGSFGLVSNALKFSNVNGTNGTYTLTTPTFILPNGATNIDYGFILSVGNTASVSDIALTIKYINTSNQVVSTTPVSISSGTSTTITLCSTITKPAIITTGASANSYQLIFTFTATGNGNTQSNLIIDDYRTSSTVSLVSLPVRFSSFTIKAVGNGASLTWNVQEEENVKSYEVERGVDGKNFSKIGVVYPSIAKTYSYSDERTLAGASYYRIKSLDADKHAIYSTVVSLKNGRSSIVFKGFPTLTHGKVTMQHDAATASANITINGIDGRVVKSIVPAMSVQETIVDLSSIQAGIYFVHYNNGNGSVETLKIIKQ